MKVAQRFSAGIRLEKYVEPAKRATENSVDWQSVARFAGLLFDFCARSQR